LPNNSFKILLITINVYIKYTQNIKPKGETHATRLIKFLKKNTRKF
jgi:hypothetical protein